jgi:hypothetical protein
MQLKNLLYSISLLVILAACSPAASTSTPLKLPTMPPTPTKSAVASCQKISIEPTPDAKETSLFPPVSEKDFVIGSKDASMTIIEYGDFQ